MSRYRRRSKRFFLGRFFLNPAAQYSTTVISAIVLSGFVFSGFLLYRYTDAEAQLALGKRLMDEGKVAFAARTFESLVQRNPNHYQGQLMLGQAYLQLGERDKAEQAFLSASAMKTGEIEDKSASIAYSKLALARKDFKKGEKQLLAAYRKNPENLELKEALFNLYDSWGDTISNDEELALTLYERALVYAFDYQHEEKLKDKLISRLQLRAQTLEQDPKQQEAALALLKRSLKYRLSPETLVRIGQTYEQAGNLDAAIDWYRKAYQANPTLISIQFSTVLMQKGHQLIDQKKPEEAETFFAEAKQISEQSKVPLDVLYPIQVAQIAFDDDIDTETGEYWPRLSVTYDGEVSRLTATRVQYYAGDVLVGEVAQPVSLPNGEKSLKVRYEPTESLGLYRFQEDPLQVKIAVNYSQGSPWKTIAIQEHKTP